MNRPLLQLFGLKWNPFSPEIPAEALVVSPRLDHFGWRLEHLVRESGFALITGDPGTGKSAALRLVAARLAALRDVVVGVIEHPQSGVSDFYRELGHLFGVSLAPRNRWGGVQGPARHVARPHRDHAAAPSARHRRGTGDVHGGAVRAAAAGERALRAHFGHRDHPDRSIVITPIGGS